MTEAAVLGPGDPPALSVMTWNIRRLLPWTRRRSPDRWERRREVMRTVLQRERPTVLGVQEALREQLVWLAPSLGYAWVGTGREIDGTGEHCAVLYDPARLGLERWGQYALSRTPEIPGSRSWGNPWFRIFVVAEFTDAGTGSRFRVVNTHLDPLSSRSRRESARLLRLVARGGWHPFDTPLPTFVMGDANAKPGSPEYRTLADGLVDAWPAAPVRLSPAWRTYSGYRAPRTGKRIDWLFATPDVAIEAAAINATRVDGVAASDHEPVQALVRLPSVAR
jgi:endonuclease/exonuclease/phosphatase family metal-dependent hydrolase